MSLWRFFSLRFFLCFCGIVAALCLFGFFAKNHNKRLSCGLEFSSPLPFFDIESGEAGDSANIQYISVKNSTNETINIEHVVASCTCLKVECPRVISPNSSVSVKLAVNPPITAFTVHSVDVRFKSSEKGGNVYGVKVLYNHKPVFWVSKRRILLNTINDLKEPVLIRFQKPMMVSEGQIFDSVLASSENIEIHHGKTERGLPLAEGRHMVGQMIGVTLGDVRKFMDGGHKVIAKVKGESDVVLPIVVEKSLFDELSRQRFIVSRVGAGAIHVYYAVGVSAEDFLVSESKDEDFMIEKITSLASCVRLDVRQLREVKARKLPFEVKLRDGSNVVIPLVYSDL